MFSIIRPTSSETNKFIENSFDAGFTYSEVGATAADLPAGYVIDRNRVKIGSGSRDLEKAKAAIRQWKMFEMPWIELCWPDAPIEPGSTVAVLAHHLGFYSLNPARIVYVIDEPERFGFAYGTLSGHGESGEERFMVEIDRESESVFYELLAFSRPGHLLTRLGYPIARHLQKRFAVHSMTAMARALAA